MKLLVGITLWLLSRVPYGLILGLSGVWLCAAWAVEVLLGVVGLAIAGTEFAQAFKDRGWKGAPCVLGRPNVPRGRPLPPVPRPPRGLPRSSFFGVSLCG
ncbi:MAG: hypothetical protein ACLQRH_07095 [Acidimicrobiales bacterium]